MGQMATMKATRGFKNVYVKYEDYDALVKELSREKKKVEKLKKTLRWFADGGPVFSVFSRTMEPTFGSVNAKQAADVLAELEALDKESEGAK